MSEIRQDLRDQLRERAEAEYNGSIDDLIQNALRALDRENGLEALILEGLNSEGDVELTADARHALRQEARDHLSNKTSP